MELHDLETRECFINHTSQSDGNRMCIVVNASRETLDEEGMEMIACTGEHVGSITMKIE